MLPFYFLSFSAGLFGELSLGLEKIFALSNENELKNIRKQWKNINGKQHLCQNFGSSVPDSRCERKMMMNYF
jgi:hypothetical protein